MKHIFVLAAFVLFLANPALADKGPIIWQDDVSLAQDSQKAIIAHNGFEEALILGTEMRSNRDVEILEFIPFPSEPAVHKAAGDPFAAISRLIAQRGLVFFRSSDFAVKGGQGAQGVTSPVEIRLSEKIGLHDVTVVKINDVKEFRNWCEGFFREKGIRADHERLSRVYESARDYTQRGYSYFVFDQVKVSGETKFIEPLLYRFKSGTMYYPLKTSNLIGGSGAVELILLLPGSVMNDVWQNIRGVFDVSRGPAIEVSSSSKVYRSELRPLGLSSFFTPGSKIYMQVLRYKGAYSFTDDLSYSLGKLKPYAYRFESTRWHGQNKEFTPKFTREEVRDLREFFCPKSGDANYMFEMLDYNLDCWSFIPGEEYEVYAAIFRNPPAGVPRRDVVLGRMTGKNDVKGTKLAFDKALVKDFNEKNKISLPLENAFPDDDRLTITFEGDTSGKFLPGTGKTYVSRVGFDEKRSSALVYVDYVAGPRSGAAYYITLRKKDGAWTVENSIMAAIH
jgi:hypothetical protein